ncbi:MAG: hypothetical protein K6E32_09065, partial [Lachnospiraceae bacterium]|nr:hypothetical protein [Lachnospiraceae bacterium]
YKRAYKLLDDRYYKSAVSDFEKILDYKDSKEKINVAKFEYVNAYKNNRDQTTLSYLEELVEINYTGAKEIYDEIYSWKVEYLGAKTSEDGKEYFAKVSKKDTIYMHFKLQGGLPNGGTTISYKTEYPDGSTDYEDVAETWYSGVTFWVRFWNNSRCKTGKLTLTFYDGNGNEIGSGTVEITN